MTNGQLVTVDITVSGGTCLTTNTAGSNSISNTVNANSTWYQDADGDGFGDYSNGVYAPNPDGSPIVERGWVEGEFYMTKNTNPTSMMSMKPRLLEGDLIEDCNAK